MALAVDIMHGYGTSNEIRIQLQPGKVVLAVNMAAKGVIHTVHYKQDGAL